MSNKLDKHRIFEFFHQLGFWSIPLVCAPLLLSLALAKSLLPSTPVRSTGAPLARDGLPQSATPSATTSPQKRSSEAERSSQSHLQSIRHSLVATNPSGSKTRSHNDRHQAKASAPVKAASDLEMKIAIANHVSNLVLATSTPGIVFDNAGHALRKLPAGQAVYAKPAGDSIDLNSWQAPPSVWIMPAQGGYVHAGEHWYRGTIRLIVQGNVLLAVNHVNLENYLSSVVGSEMWSNWPLEALKAQAVAARSYALARYVQPANPFYQMGADEAWQAYKGLDGEASSTHQAVRETSGQILSYKGGVVDSLYAATDDIVLKAHGGRGMSQEGAHTLALQGYDYLHILGAYYPGTSLARLQQSKR